MAYIGNQNYQAYVTLASQTFTTSGSTTIYALNYTVTNANNLDLYVGGSKQQPSVAYTAAGNTLTLTTATSSSMYAVYLGQGIQTVQPGNSSVGTSQLTTGAVGISNLSASGTANSSSYLRGDNTWSTISTGPSAGQVIQVVSTTVSTNLSISIGGTLTDITGLSATITPSSTSNKILVLWSVLYSNATGGNANLVLNRNGTSIAIGNASQGGTQGTISLDTANSNNYWSFNAGGSYLDSPSSTSALTYKFQGICNDGTNTFYFNRTARNGTSDINGISTITLMEIKG